MLAAVSARSCHGKGNSSTPHGPSAIEGSADNLYYLAGLKDDKKLVFWKPQKTKSAAEPKTLAFRITTHFVGTRNDGVIGPTGAETDMRGL